MATRRPAAPAPAPDPEPPAVTEGLDVPPPITLEGEVTLPGEVADPFVIGPPSAPMTPGWIMGIGTRPQTPAEHAIRLGAAAGEFNDIGFTLGTLAARANWPAPPLAAVPV